MIFFFLYLHIFSPDSPRIPPYNPQFSFAEGCEVNKEQRLWKSHQEPCASQHRQPLGLVGRGAQKRSRHQSLPPSPLPMIPLSVSERGEAWLPGTVEPTSIPAKHSPGAGCWWAPLPSVSCSTAKAGMMTAVLGCFMNLMHPLAKKGEGKNPGKYTSVSEIYTARQIWLEQSLGHIYITRLQ